MTAQDLDSKMDAAERAFREDRALLIGRDAVRDDITRLLTGPEPGRILMSGPDGVGKSTLLCAVESALSEMDVPVVTYLTGVGKANKEPMQAVASLVVQIAALIGEDVDAPDRTTLAELQRWWLDALHDAAKQLGSLVLVVRGLDLLEGQGEEALWPFRSLPAGVGLVGSSTEARSAESLADLNIRHLPLDPLPPASAREAAHRWAQASGVTLPDPVLDALGAQSRLPLWVRLAVDVLAASDAVTPMDAAGLPSEVDALAGRLLDRVHAQVGSNVADVAVGLLALSRSGLTESELVDLLSEGAGDRHLAVADLRAVLRGQVREQDRAGRLRYGHPLVRRAALARAPRDGHVRLAQRLVALQTYDHTGIMDLIWHVLHTTPAHVPEGPRNLAFALDTRAPGTEVMLIDALVATRGSGLKVLTAMSPGWLTDEGMEALLVALDGEGDRLRLQDRRALALAAFRLASGYRGERADELRSTATRLLGEVAMAGGDLPAAESAFAAAERQARQAVESDPDDPRASAALLSVLVNVAVLADEQEGRDSEVAQRAWAEAARQLEHERSRGWAPPADDPTGRDVADEHPADPGEDLQRGLADRGVQLEPGSASATTELFLAELQSRVGECMAILLTDEAMEEIADLAAGAGGEAAAQARLRELVPSHRDVTSDSWGALLADLVALAVDGTVPALTAWPVELPRFGTRAEVLLWCRGFRPAPEDLMAASEALGQEAGQRNWEEQAQSLTEEQRTAFVDLQQRVGRGEVERDALPALWSSFFDDERARYLFHLGEVVNDFLARSRGREE